MAIQLVNHIVRKGESLDKIARKYGLTGWREVYYASCNDSLRRRRPKPEKLSVGDKVVIPPDALYYTQVKLDKLQKVRKDTEEMMDKIEREWDAEYRKTKSNIATIDVVGKISTIIVHLGGLVKDGMAAMKLSGEALAEANKKIAQTAVGHTRDELVGVAVEASGILQEKSTDHLAVAVGKQVADTFFNLTTPSWWASKIDHLKNGGQFMKNGRIQGTDLDQINRQTVDLIRKQKADTLNALDKKIREAENQLIEAKYLKIQLN